MPTTKRVLIILLKLTPLLVPLILYLVVQQFHQAYIFPAEGEVIDFHVFQQARTMPLMLAFCIVPIAIIAAIAWLFLGEAIWSKNVASSVILALILVNGLACFSTLGLVFARFEHFDRAQTNNHVYYLDSIWKVGIGHNSAALFALFECDNEGVMCKIIFSRLYHPTEEEYKAMYAELVVPPDNNRVLMQIEGEIVYSHSPS